MATLITSGFKPGDDEAAVEILGQWDGGPLSDLLFTQIAAMIPLVGIEVVVLRWRDEIETLLIPRPDGDKAKFYFENRQEIAQKNY